MKINDILRASGVQRWHIVRTVRNQSLAEHTFDVVMIARAIAKIAGVDDYEIIKAALLHDLDEIITGDIPTPTKEKARANGWELNNLYQTITGRPLSKEEVDVVKLADKLADVYFINDHALGNHADMVCDQLTNEWNGIMTSGKIGPDYKIYPWVLKGAREVSRQLQRRDFTI